MISASGSAVDGVTTCSLERMLASVHPSARPEHQSDQYAVSEAGHAVAQSNARIQLAVSDTRRSWHAEHLQLAASGQIEQDALLRRLEEAEQAAAKAEERCERLEIEVEAVKASSAAASEVAMAKAQQAAEELAAARAETATERATKESVEAAMAELARINKERTEALEVATKKVITGTSVRLLHRDKTGFEATASTMNRCTIHRV